MNESREINGSEQEGNGSIWLIPHLQRRLQENRNANLIFVGDTGSGKSYSAISLAEQLDDSFSADRIVFTVGDFLHLVNSNLPRGSVIVFDDAGLGVPAREWQNLSAKIFGMLFQGFRYKGLISMITVPDMSFIERQSRTLMHLYFEASDTQGLMKPFKPFHPIRGDDRLGFKYPTIQRGGKTISVKLVQFPLASQALLDAYEKKKTQYMEGKNKLFEEEIRLRAEFDEALKQERDAKIETAMAAAARRRELIKNIKDLHEKGYTQNQIAKELRTAQSTVSVYLSRMKE